MSRAGLLAVALACVAVCSPGRSAAQPGIAFPPATFLSPIPDDPFPIRRVFLPPNRTPDGTSNFVRLPRDEFERKVRAASDALRRPPRIAAAQYTATLVDGALAGTAEWTIRNPDGRNGTLSLDPHRLALARPRWADGTTARLIRSTQDESPKTVAWLDGKNAADGSRLQADWSVRASGEPGESRFELRMPPAGIATLTLTLPGNLIPRVSADDALVTGPSPTDDPARHRWRIAFGGRSSLNLVLAASERNRITQPGPVKTSLRLALGEGRAEGTFRFELDPAHEPGDAYVLAVDDRVTVHSVVADVPIDWEREAPQSIRIVPREAGRIGRINVAVAAAPPIPSSPWSVPAVTLRHAIPAETTIQLRIASDLRPVQMESGDFRLSEADQTDAGRTLTWTSTLARPDVRVRQWPSLAFVLPEADVSVSDRATFIVGSTDCFLRVTATIAIQRGPVSTLEFTVPEPYRMAVAPSVPTDPMATVRFDESKPARWVITFSRPLATGQSASVGFSLSAPLPGKQNGVVRIGVPAVTWSSATRTGSATVSASPEWTPLSPLVVAYQDLPPTGELFIREAEPVPPGKATAPDARILPAGSIVPVRPDHADATVGDRSTAIVLKGMTGRTGDRTRVPLPPGSTVRAVRLGDRAIDHPHIEADNVILPACISETMPFEIQIEMGRTGALIEIIRVAWPDGTALPIHWTGESNWLVATGGNGESAFTVRREVATGMGWLMAACLLVPLARFLLAGPSSRRALIVLFVAAVVCGSFVAGRLAGPAFVPPLVVSLIGLLIVFVRTAPTVAVAAILLGVSAEAAAPQPVEVYLMYGTGDESNALFVFVPKSLLDRLDRLSGKAEPDFAILTARYSGTEQPDEVAVRAEWTVHVPSEGPYRLNVPLTGAKLESVSLDGSPAFPEPLPNGGFSLSLPNRGAHVVSATFAVPIRAVDREREIRFSGPDVALATVEFTAKNASTPIDVISRRGRQTASIRDGHSVTTAELGEWRTVTIRWRDPDTKPVAASTDTTLEAAVWDVDESEAILTAAIQFPANHGADYRIRVPAGLSLIRVTAHAADGGPPLPIETKRNGEIMTVSPRLPIDGKLTVILTLVLERLVTAQTRIAFPRAGDRPDPSAVYAIRLNGLVAAEFGRTGVIDLPADAAVRAALPFPELNLDARPATRAFRRTAENVELAPRLSVPLANPQWNGSMTWTMGARADVLAEWQCTGPLPGVVSFALPPALTLASLRGPDVIDTTFDNGRFTLWLRTGDDPGPIRHVATMAQPKNGEFVVPVIRPPQSDKTIARIRPAAGYAVRVPPTTGVTPLDEGTYEIAAGVDSFRVAVTAVDPPKPIPLLGSQPSTAIAPPAITTQQSQTSPTAASRSPQTNILIWLVGMVLLGIAFARPLQSVRPELILGWGVLAWIVWSPLAAVGVILGIALRIVRSLRETPSPAR